MPTIQPNLTTSPQISTSDGNYVVARRRAIIVPAGVPMSVSWTMSDNLGNNYDLTSLAGSGSVEARGIQSVTNGPVNYISMAGSFLNAAAGQVSFTIDPMLVTAPGVFTIDVAVKDSSGTPNCLDRFYMFVDRSTWATNIDDNGPPSLGEIRIFMRDSGREDNLWLNDQEFDTAEICAAIERCVRHWNEVNPPIPQKYTTTTWPQRERLLVGIASQLYLMVARHYRRVHLPYNAAGLAIDDHNKAQEYEQTGQQLWQEYSTWVKDQKVMLNMNAAMGVLGSGYGMMGSVGGWY